MKQSLLDSIADWTATKMGSTISIIVHTIIFLGFAVLYLLDYDATKILLILTMLVSLEAIYLSIFIQRSVNRQSHKMDLVINSIRENTVPHLKKPLDMVVGEISEELKDVDQRVRHIERNGQKRKR